MKLTYREKILLVILGFIAIIALEYYLIFQPQLNKIQNLLLDQRNCRMEVQRVKAEISPDNTIHKDFEVMNTRIEEKTVRFFPVVLQDKIIVVLDGILGKIPVKADSMNFTVIDVKPVERRKAATKKQFPVRDLVDEYKMLSDEDNSAVETNKAAEAVKSVQPDNNQLLAENMEIDIQFESSYAQLMSFIKEIEAMNRTIVIKRLNVTKGQGDVLKGNVQLEFFALPKIHEQDSEYFNWIYINTYGSENPFK